MNCSLQWAEQGLESLLIGNTFAFETVGHDAQALGEPTPSVRPHSLFTVPVIKGLDQQSAADLCGPSRTRMNIDDASPLRVAQASS